MANKIKVQIYGIYDGTVLIGCTSKVNSCSNCDSHTDDVSNKSSSCNSCHGCGNDKESKTDRNLNTIGKAYEDLSTFIKSTDVSDNTELEFIDISKIKLEDDSDIKSLIDRGFDSPFTVIDGIVRFYGGMSGISVYKDIKELLS